MIPRSGVTGIVMYGSGRHFSSGADLDDLIGSRDEPELSPVLIENLRSFRYFESLEIPVVAAIRGVCLGSALELALFCHCRICGEGAVLGLPETTFGLIPGCGGIYKMNALTGMGRAMELILSGSSFTAEEALRWNLVDALVPKKDVVSISIGLIKSIGQGYRSARMGACMYRFLKQGHDNERS